MSPIAIPQQNDAHTIDIASLKQSLTGVEKLTLPPDNTLKRYQKAGIDLSNGYPYFPPKPEFVQEVQKIRTDLREYVDPGTRADPEKKALFEAAEKVTNLTTNIGVSSSLNLGTGAHGRIRPKSSVFSSKTSRINRRMNWLCLWRRGA